MRDIKNSLNVESDRENHGHAFLQRRNGMRVTAIAPNGNEIGRDGPQITRSPAVGYDGTDRNLRAAAMRQAFICNER